MKHPGFIIVFLILLLSFGESCKHNPIEPLPLEVDMEDDTVVFAVIGDYGLAGDAEEEVAMMVLGWKPDLILTTGDNNYPYGEYNTLVENIGQYYHDYIYNPDAPYEFRCNGTANDSGFNRFFPCPGNHDASNLRGLKPYLDYFTLPGEEDHYRLRWGPAAFFSLNSLSGINKQKEWLQKELETTDKPFKLVFFHHSPYSPGPHGDSQSMQWPFAEWGADLVLTGHDHIYARIERSDEPGLHYIVTGAGGKSLYSCDSTRFKEDPFTSLCTAADYGAVYGRITGNELYLAYFLISQQDTPFDELRIFK